MPSLRVTGRPGPATSAEVADALGLLAVVWTVLAAGRGLAAWLGADVAILASFGLATAVCAVDAATRRRVATRAERGGRRRRAGCRARVPGGRRVPRRRPDTPGGRSRVAAIARAVLRFAAFVGVGHLVAPGLIAIALAAGAVLGAFPGAHAAGPDGPVRLLATLALAPAFEEHVYRGRVLPALVPRLGRIPAVVVSSALFALPHLAPIAMLGGFVAGLVLGGVRLRTGRTADAIALHAGLNLAAAAVAGRLPFDAPTVDGPTSLAAGLAAAAWRVTPASVRGARALARRFDGRRRTARGAPPAPATRRGTRP